LGRGCSSTCYMPWAIDGEPLSATRGQCDADARPMVTSPAARHHCPLAGTKLYCLVTDAQLAQGCTRQRGDWDSQAESCPCRKFRWNWLISFWLYSSSSSGSKSGLDSDQSNAINTANCTESHPLHFELSCLQTDKPIWLHYLPILSKEILLLHIFLAHHLPARSKIGKEAKQKWHLFGGNLFSIGRVGVLLLLCLFTEILHNATVCLQLRVENLSTTTNTQSLSLSTFV